VNPLGGSVRYRFELARSDRGPWTLSPLRSAGSGTGDVAVSARIDGLAPKTRYLARLVAIRGQQTVRTDARAFWTAAS
jgi:hypothetical protein